MKSVIASHYSMFTKQWNNYFIGQIKSHKPSIFYQLFPLIFKLHMFWPLPP